VIRQNIEIKCESDNPDVLTVYSELIDLDGYFCVVHLNDKYRGKIDGLPLYSKITVSSLARNPMNKDNIIYEDKVLTFDVTLISNIIVELKYRD
jgi:hypothetical protein